MINGWGMAVFAAVLVIAVIWWWRMKGSNGHGSDAMTDLTIDLSALPILAVSDKPTIDSIPCPSNCECL